jgi:hypothetical protein
MRYAIWIIVAAAIGPACSNAADDAVPKPPSGFTFEAIGEKSFVSFGWAGNVHDIKVPDGTPFGVTTVDCQGSDGPCQFEGPHQPTSAVQRQRCLNRMSVACEKDSECQSQPADPVHDKCVFIYDPPTGTPLVSLDGKPGACGWSYIPITAENGGPAIIGSLDQTSGELTLQSLTINLALNGNGGAYRGSCAECVGDGPANDGKKEGRCMPTTGASDLSPDIAAGTPCDVNRIGTIPGYTGRYSMDCAPTVRPDDGVTSFGGAFFSGGLELKLTDASPSCTDPAFAGQKCFCGVCPDTITGCMSDRECGGAKCGFLPSDCNPNPLPSSPGYDFHFLPGECRTTSSIQQIATRPNDCIDTCHWSSDTLLGTCTSVLPGVGTIGCYPAGAGSAITVPDHAVKDQSTYIVDTASARCGNPSASPQLNRQVGLPGLTFQKRSFRIRPDYTP